MSPSTSARSSSSSSETSTTSSGGGGSSCPLETGYYLAPREPCETYSQFGRLPALNTDGWSVLCVAPGRLTDTFGVSADLDDTTTMFVDKTLKYDAFSPPLNYYYHYNRFTTLCLRLLG